MALLSLHWASLVAQMVKNPPAMRETRFDLWVRKIPWRKEWQPTPVFFAWRIPWMEETGGLQFTGSQRIGHDCVTNTCAASALLHAGFL